ncbi:hypothetical protein [Streptomyces sp. NPDC051677]|uniref:hypothetical protein n=1 Tax=Streptomyces sp. NPDC051677 TaxID=3365669 RepID=UPI0037D64A7C
MITLYRADAPGLSVIEGLTSWTSSREHALDYASGRFLVFGGPCLYRAEVDAGSVLDARGSLRQTLDEMGLDLDDYPNESPQDLCRALANIFRAHGHLWIAFRERPEPEFDEWLYLGDWPVAVLPNESA